MMLVDGFPDVARTSSDLGLGGETTEQALLELVWNTRTITRLGKSDLFRLSGISRLVSEADLRRQHLRTFTSMRSFLSTPRG